MIRQRIVANQLMLSHSMPRVRVLRKLLLVVALSSGAGVFGAAGAQQPGKINIQSFTLENGLQVHLVEDHSTQVVAVDLWYNVGARNERPGRTGFAHLFEHMMFQGVGERR